VLPLCIYLFHVVVLPVNHQLAINIMCVCNFILNCEFLLNIAIPVRFCTLVYPSPIFVPDYSGLGLVSSDKMQKRKHERGFYVCFHSFHA
jgi:hypothetical protein